MMDEAPQSSSVVTSMWLDVLERKLAGEQKKLLLNVGSGPDNPLKLPAAFRNEGWCEIRVDIEPAVKPDVLGSITDLSAVPADAVDAVYSSHNLEHIFTHEVPAALREFLRVLKPGGLLVVTMPDLQAVCEVIARGDVDRIIYSSVDGKTPIRALDIIYGWGAMIAQGQVYMAHRTGFTEATLRRYLGEAGFENIRSQKGQIMDLWANATKPGRVMTDLIG